jgi:transposase-like protein
MYGLKHNNNPIERYNEDIKQRYKVMRRFNSLAFLDLRRIVCNFVRGNETRATRAGIALDLGRNRLK